MKLTDVIRRPLITEKTTLMREDGRTLVFEVARGATKVDIKRAVEKLLGSKVETVRTAIAHGKMKLAILFAQLDRQFGGPRMPDDIGERFLTDAKTLGFDHRIDPVL